MMKRVIVGCMLLLLIPHANAQGDKEFLRAVLKTMERENASGDKNQVCYMNYSLHTVSMDTLQKPTDVIIEVWKKNKMMEVKNSQMNVFQDEKEVFIVLPDKQLVVRNDAAFKKEDGQSVTRYLSIFDSLLNYSTVTRNQVVKSKGYDRQVSIAINEKGQYIFKMKKIDYFIDSGAKKIKKVRMHYENSTSGIDYVDYTINELNNNFKGKDFPDQVATQFLNGNNLKEKYKGYKLVDNRASVKKREKYKE